MIDLRRQLADFLRHHAEDRAALPARLAVLDDACFLRQAQEM
ncbi:hypothetical protein [Alcanivorax sp. 24]|nr:hypothetical protein [Alcanivorax sp. 24]